MFSIDGFQPQDIAVEYVCNYTSLRTGFTSQVRMKPSENTNVSVKQAGEYKVQVGQGSTTAATADYMTLRMRA